jgi:hypothetical protein
VARREHRPAPSKYFFHCLIFVVYLQQNKKKAKAKGKKKCYTKKDYKMLNCRYGGAWQIVAATCQRAAAGRHARRQDRQYHN